MHVSILLLSTNNRIQIHSKKGVNGRKEKIAIYNRLLNGPLEGSSKVERLWYEVDHHISHGMLGLFDSPFAHPLVVSYDGGGNDGLGFIFAGRREGSSDGTVLEELETVAINLAVGCTFKEHPLRLVLSKPLKASHLDTLGLPAPPFCSSLQT